MFQFLSLSYTEKKRIGKKQIKINVYMYILQIRKFEYLGKQNQHEISIISNNSPCLCRQNNLLS